VRTLTDLNPAYQTLATGPDGEHAVYGRASGVPQTGTHPALSAALQLALVLAGVLILAAAAVVLIRRRRR